MFVSRSVSVYKHRSWAIFGLEAVVWLDSKQEPCLLPLRRCSAVPNITLALSCD